MHYLDYHESVTHGTRRFPLAYYMVNDQHPRYQMPYHWHREYELLYIREGSFSLSLDGVDIPAQQGDLLFIQSGCVHGGIPQSCVYECLVFDLDILPAQTEAQRALIRQITRQNVRISPLFHTRGGELSGIIPALFHAAAGGETGYELEVSGYLCLFFSWIFRRQLYADVAETPSLRLKNLEPFRQALEYIEQHYASLIRLEDLSRTAGMSPKYFCRYFSTVAHQTPMEYVNYYRVERACQALSSTEWPVTEIGYRCGFRDTAYFIRVFKKQTGLPPGQYRKNQEAAARTSQDSSASRSRTDVWHGMK